MSVYIFDVATNTSNKINLFSNLSQLKYEIQICNKEFLFRIRHMCLILSCYGLILWTSRWLKFIKCKLFSIKITGVPSISPTETELYKDIVSLEGLETCRKRSVLCRGFGSRGSTGSNTPPSHQSSFLSVNSKCMVQSNLQGYHQQQSYTKHRVCKGKGITPSERRKNGLTDRKRGRPEAVVKSWDESVESTRVT